MDLKPVINRLRERLTGVRSVGGAADLEAALRGVVVAPAVFVVPLARRGREMPRTGPTRQHISSLFGVLQVVESFRDNVGEAALVDLDALGKQIFDALVGWVQDEMTGEPVVFVQGELIQAEGDGRVWWSDEFQLTSYYRSP